jgi:hypothetical protein
MICWMQLTPQLLLMNDEAYLSLLAMSRQLHQKSIQLRAMVKNHALVILVDSGSSHTFQNSKMVHKIHVITSHVPPMSVKVANGALLSFTSVGKGFEWWIQGHTFQMDAKKLEMGASDLVLGMDWLNQFGPKVCD